MQIPLLFFCFSNMFSNHRKSNTNIRQFVSTKTEQSKMIHPTRSLQLNDRFDFITIQIQVYHSLVHRIRCKWPQILYLRFKVLCFSLSFSLLLSTKKTWKCQLSVSQPCFQINEEWQCLRAKSLASRLIHDGYNLPKQKPLIACKCAFLRYQPRIPIHIHIQSLYTPLSKSEIVNLSSFERSTDLQINDRCYE